MIYITHGASIQDPTDLCRIKVTSEKHPGGTYLAVEDFIWIPFWRASWWVNLYRLVLVGLIRKHVRKTLKETAAFHDI